LDFSLPVSFQFSRTVDTCPNGIADPENMRKAVGISCYHVYELRYT